MIFVIVTQKKRKRLALLTNSFFIKDVARVKFVVILAVRTHNFTVAAKGVRVDQLVINTKAFKN